VFFCVRDTAATRGQYLALSKADDLVIIITDIINVVVIIISINLSAGGR